ncbi:MAG: 1-deoxy-D-xylulose-5-phosphate reductoisomerase [Oscillospiraceae bacterium]|nr:1-deoxy-D-xylulose-5-phosphate reductoisomerase [Oscillospiraceae bacterium]
MKNISILGSTGSIGTQALEVCEKIGAKVYAITANNNLDLLEEQARKFKVELVSITNKELYTDLKTRLADTNIKVCCGEEGLLEAATYDKSDTVLNSVVGIAGLIPTMEAINAGKDIALANKETLVTGGKLVIEAAKKKGVKILPVDSEHSAIFQCMQGCSEKEIKKIILTASGGPFFGFTYEQLKNVTKAQALKHPNWSMGAKITIDSATLMNKGLELIEAAWLFNKKAEDIEIVVHRESVIHSLIELCDNAVLAQLGTPDMKIPIQYALTYPDRLECDTKCLSLTDYTNLTFYKPDYQTFKALAACKKAIELGGLYPCAVNCANEQAVKMFLDDKISFLRIGELVEEALHFKDYSGNYTLNDIMNTNLEIREYVKTIA